MSGTALQKHGLCFLFCGVRARWCQGESEALRRYFARMVRIVVPGTSDVAKVRGRGPGPQLDPCGRATSPTILLRCEPQAFVSGHSLKRQGRPGVAHSRPPLPSRGGQCAVDIRLGQCPHGAHISLPSLCDIARLATKVPLARLAAQTHDNVDIPEHCPRQLRAETLRVVEVAALVRLG